MAKELNVVEEEQWVAERSCGDCQACCHELPVIATKPAMKKPPKTNCQYQCEKGCSIYEERPEPCRTYLCQWAIGWGAEHWRPDKWGLIVEANTMTMAITICEIRRDAIQQPEFKQLLPLLADQASVILLTMDKEMVVFAKDQAEIDRLEKVQTGLEQEFERIVALAEDAMQSDCTNKKENES